MLNVIRIIHPYADQDVGGAVAPWFGRSLLARPDEGLSRHYPYARLDQAGPVAPMMTRAVVPCGPDNADIVRGYPYAMLAQTGVVAPMQLRTFAANECEEPPPPGCGAWCLPDLTVTIAGLGDCHFEGLNPVDETWEYYSQVNGTYTVHPATTGAYCSGRCHYLLEGTYLELWPWWEDNYGEGRFWIPWRLLISWQLACPSYVIPSPTLDRGWWLDLWVGGIWNMSALLIRFKTAELLGLTLCNNQVAHPAQSYSYASAEGDFYFGTGQSQCAEGWDDLHSMPITVTVT